MNHKTVLTLGAAKRQDEAQAEFNRDHHELGTLETSALLRIFVQSSDDDQTETDRAV